MRLITVLFDKDVIYHCIASSLLETVNLSKDDGYDNKWQQFPSNYINLEHHRSKAYLY